MKSIARRTASGLLAAAAGATLFVGGATAADAAPAPTLGPVHAALPYGPYTCGSGYVWRGIGSNDPVCVTPQSRQTAGSENAAGPSHRAGSGPYGPDTCTSGFVWRLAQPGDHVCVAPGARDRVSAENQNSVRTLADPSQLPYGSVQTSDQHDQLKCYLYGGGRDNHATPYAGQWFFGVGIPGVGVGSAGTAYADANGNVPSTLLRGTYRNGNGPVGIATVVTDTATGIVTRAGTTNSYGNC